MPRPSIALALALDLALTLALISPLALLHGCANPAITDATFAGDDTECSATFICEGDCGGVEYKFTCTFNDANDIYDCSCTAGGSEGESFSEAGVCERDADGNFIDLDLADASAHAIEDCKFPLTASIEEDSDDE